uniref:Coiled-coil domain containing 137 n=1 Tax=Tetraodon nigroviridis TaxID=99883 RepID=H3CWP3_TETNG
TRQSTCTLVLLCRKESCRNMGKNKKDKKQSEPGKQPNRTGKRPSQTLKGRGKPKKAEPDHLQHIPFKLREIMKSKDRMKKALLKPKKPKKVGVGLTGVSPVVPSGDPCDGEIPVPHFQRGRRESEKAFVRRMENETKHVLFLTRNQVDRKPEQDGDEKPSSKSKSEKKKTYDSFKLQRLQQKKYERQEARLEKQMFVDDVPFGEVVLAPPSLSSKPKNAQVKSQKDSGTLLLHSLLGHSVTSTNKPSMARQRMMEEERERAVQAYRCLKKQRQEQHEAR